MNDDEAGPSVGKLQTVSMNLTGVSFEVHQNRMIFRDDTNTS